VKYGGQNGSGNAPGSCVASRVQVKMELGSNVPTPPFFQSMTQVS